jgi:hypothetical protein
MKPRDIRIFRRRLWSITARKRHIAYRTVHSDGCRYRLDYYQLRELGASGPHTLIRWPRTFHDYHNVQVFPVMNLSVVIISLAL